jgi:hypothetical protein
MVQVKLIQLLTILNKSDHLWDASRPSNAEIEVQTGKHTLLRVEVLRADGFKRGKHCALLVDLENMDFADRFAWDGVVTANETDVVFIEGLGSVSEQVSIMGEIV